MKFSIRYADRIVGLFVLAAVLILVVLIFLLGSNQRWFAKNYYYSSQFPSANNLSVGMGIMFKGFEIGKISKVKLNAEDMVDVEFYIYDTYADRVKENSILELSVSPIGLGTSLLFHKGKSAQPLPELSFVPSSDLEEGRLIIEDGLVDMPKKDDTITRLLANVNQLMENVNRTVVLLNQAIEGRGGGQLGDIFTGVKTAVSSIGGGTTTLLSNANGMVTDLSVSVPSLIKQLQDISVQLGSVMTQVNGITGNLKQTTDSFADPTGLIPKLLGNKGSIATFLDDGNQLWDKVGAIMASLQQTTTDLQKTMSGVSGEVPRLSGLLLDAKRVLEQTQDVMEGLRNNPLLKGGIPEKPVQESRMNSLRGEEF